jgi:hypothetical protein
MDVCVVCCAVQAKKQVRAIGPKGHAREAKKVKEKESKLTPWSREANRDTTTPEIPRILCNPKDNYRVYNSV